jgi:hypothetical protein
VRSPEIVRIELEYSILHEKVVRGANHAVCAHFSSVLDNRLRQRRLARSRKSSHHNEHPWDITQVRPPSLVDNTHEWVDDPAGDVIVVLHVRPGTNELREVRKEKGQLVVGVKNAILTKMAAPLDSLRVGATPAR